MLALNRFHDEPQQLLKAFQNKKLTNAEAIVNQVAQLAEQRKTIIQELDNARAEMNQAAKSIGQLMSQGKKDEAETAKANTKNLKTRIAEKEDELKSTSEELNKLLAGLPNPAHPSVPVGFTEADNVIVEEGGSPLVTRAEGALLPHWELAEKHQLIDFERGTKVTGAGFPVYTGKGARLQRALINFFLDRAAAQGYQETEPPFLINRNSGFGTGQLPDKDGQMYHISADDLFLIPTAEVPLTNLFREEILPGDALPQKRCAYSPCFRREAGSYGKDVRGLNRLHQFDKVEIVQLVHPEESYHTLEQMREYATGLLNALELQWRTLLLCTGDTTFAAAKTYDLEVYSAAQERWLEVSSVSNFEEFQARRMNCRFRSEGKKTQFVHTLNGSALALPRIVAALLEHHQQPDGSIRIPQALQAYTGFDTIG